MVAVHAATMVVAVFLLPGAAAFEVDDYFRLKRVTEVALSPTGDRVVFAVQSRSVDANRVDREVFLAETDRSRPPIRVETLRNSRAFAWSGRSEISFIANVGGLPQVQSMDVVSHQTRQWTKSPAPVAIYSITASGTLAYIARPVSDGSASLYRRLHEGREGVVIDSSRVSVYDFLDPGYQPAYAPATGVLWIARPGQVPYQVPVPGDVHSISWSPNGQSLSVVYMDHDMPASQLRTLRTSVGVVDAANRFRSIAIAYPPREGRPGRRFSGGEWLPNSSQILIRRVIERHPWYGESAWAVTDSGVPLSEDSLNWQATDGYGGARYFPISDAEVQVEGVQRAVRGLYRWRGDSSVKLLTGDLDGSSSNFSFSLDRNHAAFVNQSMIRPPEIYYSRSDASAIKLTELNESLAPRDERTVREVNWLASDGVKVSGWLLEPRPGKSPRPMITFVHGGPAFPMTNAFAPYFETWPYPFDAYVSAGIAVFFPNYRGTASYGAEFMPKRLDGEPVDDIIRGIQHLIASNVADQGKLGISGQSWGAWLGPMVMTRWNRFCAGSFAEGAPSPLTNLDVMQSEQTTREIGHAIWGGSHYDVPMKYLDASPHYKLKGNRAASLFEGGIRTNGIAMLAYGKAALHFGVAAETIMYPQTGHNITLPTLQKESAHRNLDWFRFWLQDFEDSAPGWKDQYERWRKLGARNTPNAPCP